MGGRRIFEKIVQHKSVWTFILVLSHIRRFAALSIVGA